MRLVEEWSAAHPRKTRQGMFLEQWPNARVDSYGVLDIEPCTVSQLRTWWKWYGARTANTAVKEKRTVFCTIHDDMCARKNYFCADGER